MDGNDYWQRDIHFQGLYIIRSLFQAFFQEPGKYQVNVLADNVNIISTRSPQRFSFHGTVRESLYYSSLESESDEDYWYTGDC